MKLDYARFVRETGVFVTLTFFIKFCSDRPGMSFEQLTEAFFNEYGNKIIQAGSVRIITGDVISDSLGDNADETELLITLSAVLDQTFRNYARTREELKNAEIRMKACDAMTERYRMALEALEERVTLLSERAANLELMMTDNSIDPARKYRIPPS